MSNKNFLATLVTGFKWSLSAAFFLVTSVLILYVCYLFGHVVLDGGVGSGGDTALHLSIMNRLETFYPKIPLWFPYAGAGSSVVLGYWVFPHYIAIFASHLTNLTKEQWFKILEFISVPIVSIEIYIYLWVRFKNQIMALIGGLIYPLSSIAWGWVAHAGFFGQQLSIISYVPALLFFDLYLEEELKTDGGLKLRKRLYLVFFYIVMALGVLLHASVLPSFYLGLPIYALIRSQLNPRGDKKRIISLLKSIKVVLIFILLGLVSGGFFLIPQLKYYSSQPYTPTFGPNDTPILPWKGFLGFARLPANIGSLYTPIFMSILVSIFAIVGSLLAVIKRKFIGALGIVAFSFVFLLSAAKSLAINYPFLRILILPTAIRIASITAIYLTILAAYGIWSTGDLPGIIIRTVVAKISKARFLSLMTSGVTFAISTVLSLTLLGYSFYHFRQMQRYAPSVSEWGSLEGYPGYGTLAFSVPLCKVPGWADELIGTNFTCGNFMPSWRVDDFDVDMWSQDFAEEFAKIPKDEFTRFGTSPNLTYIKYSFARHSTSSIVSTIGTTMINIDWLGPYDNVMFLKGNYTPTEVDEYAKWFGTKYSILSSEADVEAISRYQKDKWLDLTDSGAIIKEFKSSPGTVNISNKPTILFIGKEDNIGYESALQIFIKGVVSYDDALVVKGKENIDDYSAKELSNFNVVLLRGYQYKNKEKAWFILEDYVSSGGSLFIDTGWQFVNKDWGAGPDNNGKYQTVSLPLPSPVKNASWGGIGTSWVNASLSTGVGTGLSLDKFGAPKWEDKAWGMALANKKDLLPWAEAVISSKDMIVVAKGKYGEGRVVWSGMNLFSHAFDKDSEEEYKFLNKIFDYLIVKKEYQQGSYTASWNYPDEVDFDLGQVPPDSFLYFAETYMPYWKAYLEDAGKKSSLQIYSAGPRFMAVKLPSNSSGRKLVFRYDMRSIIIFSALVTLLGFLAVLVTIVDVLFLKGAIEAKTFPFFNKLRKFTRLRLSNVFKDDEDEGY